MTILELIQMCERRITHLQSVRASASAVGDVTQVDRLDADINETQNTLAQLRSLLD